MKMPIPSDWDGETTCDYKVTWPKSDTWRAILRGLLTEPDISDFWDETTGDLEYLLRKFDPIMVAALDNLECGDMNIPIGSIFIFAGGVVPDNWLACDGHTELIEDYPELYEIIGDNYQYGLPVAPGYFYVPDLGGRVPVGIKFGDGDFGFLGVNGGEKTVTLSTNQMPVHTHIQNAHNHTQDAHSHGLLISSQALAGATRSTIWGTGTSTNGLLSSSVATNQPATATNQNAGAGQSHNNLSPYVVINCIIRAK